MPNKKRIIKKIGRISKRMCKTVGCKTGKIQRLQKKTRRLARKLNK